MKKAILIFSLVTISFTLISQVPQGFSYQAIAFYSNGNPVVSNTVSVRISILDNSSSGTILYTESHTKLTNNKGLFSLVIGQGTPTIGTFGGINWAINSKFVKVELDPNGGTNYINIGINQLMSVPYALVAGQAMSANQVIGSTPLKGKEIVFFSDTISDASAATIIANEVGDDTKQIYVLGCTNLTALDLSKVKSLEKFECIDNLNLKSVNFSGLIRVGDFVISENESIDNVNVSNLHFSHSINISYSPMLSNINFSNLVRCNSIGVYYTNLASLIFPNLVNVKTNIYIAQNQNLSSITFNNPISLKEISITNNKNLTTLNFSTISSVFGRNLYLGSNKFSTSTINSILNKFKNISPSITGKVINIDLQNPLAPPSGQGLIDKATLISNGNIVMTD